jgi:hypothetical protein
MSRIYIVLLFIAATSVSCVGAFFSIIGLTSLFAGAVVSVGLMALVLEFAKIVTAGFLYRYWGHVNRVMRIYLSSAVVVLSIITSMGIFGYLSNAYQRSSLTYKTSQLKIDSLNRADAAITAEIHKIEKFISEIPNSRISKKFALYEESQNHIKSLVVKSEAINLEIEDIRRQLLDIQTEIGPVVYVAETFGVQVDTVAKWLIFVFVSVLDPLAICLVFALNLAIRLREKYRGDEYRIGRLSLTKPVDHRRKKAA